MRFLSRSFARRHLALIFCLVMGLWGSTSLQAQPTTGQITLNVTDPSGAPMSVSGRLRNVSGAELRLFRVDGQGVVHLDNLRPGRYQVELFRAGFAAQIITVDVDAAGSETKAVQMSLAPQALKVDVVSATPLPGTDLLISQIPSPVQTVSADDLLQTNSLDLTALLNQRLSGVYINENQVNPFQPDVNYRGYTASPLLGTPEGLSVYMDGVRQNQPFGDVVAWDLIPKIAISEVALMPGSNPLFGLNTLGGALAITTKDGNIAPGLMLDVYGGSFGRRAGELQYGGSNAKTGLSWYGAGNLFREDGWRQFSPSEVRQAFAKVNWAHNKTFLSASFGYADNWLTGNGLQDTRTLATQYNSVFSIPDVTWNRSPSVILNARHNLTPNLTLSGNAYFRYIRADTTNGDINDDSFDQQLYNLSDDDVAALTAAGYSGFPVTGNYMTEPFPKWRCIAQGLQFDEPSEKCTGLITNTFNKQNNYGLAGQLSWFFKHNHITAGSGWDRSSMTFQQGSQFGYLNPDRITITPIDSFADGSTSEDGEPVDTRVNLHGLVNTFSIYATDTLTLGKQWTVTLSGRYNRTSVQNRDRLPVDPTDARGSLNGDYVFDRFNPAAGLTYTPSRFASFYFSYSEASRAPTAIELGCADPDEPCNLPNALVGDPPLKQVVSRTFEAGVRSAGEGNLRWSAGWFRGENSNDLLFVASQQTGFGYFKNFGKTRRQGTEISISDKIGHFVLGGNYTFLDATYQTSELIGGSANSTNDGGAGLEGNISISPGDRIPLVPRNLLKAFVDYQPTSKLDIDLEFLAAGRSYVRGNENNLDQPDGLYYLGNGFTPGYGVLNLGARYQVQKHVQVFGQINNLLNHHYYTSGQLGPTPYDNAGNFIARPFPGSDDDYPIRTSTFYAPGAPIGAWAGVRVTF
jgi:outer membrane receptor protein involved in Fe transport